MLIGHDHHRAERCGAVTPWIVLSLTAIVGIVAIGMDGGRLQEERRKVQAAADAAALAGGTQLYTNFWGGSGSVTTAAQNAAATNGYSHGGTITVTVNSPPLSGNFAGQANYVEVIIQSQVSATFGALFTGQGMPVTARAVARGQPYNIGIMALASSGSGAFTNKSLGLFAVLGASIYVNSSDPAAFTQAGILPIAASSYEIAGGYVNTGGGLILGTLDTGVAPSPDPLATYPLPNSSSYSVQSNSAKTINSLLPTILSPGVYKGGLNIQGISIVTMLPGIYVMEGGGFQVSGLASVVGLEVMIYNTSGTAAAGPITIDTTGAVTLVPPLSGTYQGFGIIQDRSVSQPISITGVGVTAIAGTIYAPAAALSLTDTLSAGLDTLGGAYICNTITVGGVGNININLGSHYVRVPDITLVE